MFKKNRSALALIVSCVAIVAASADPAFAASTGLAAVDTGKSAATTAIQGIAGIGAIVLIGVLVWDYVQHRNLRNALIEFVGVIIAGLIAANAGAVAGVFGLGGALIR